MSNLFATTASTLRCILCCAVVASIAPATASADWLTMPSKFTHDPVTGARVDQYTPVAAPEAPQVANFRSSGFTHTRSSIIFGQSADNYHRVEEWGDPVRPYGEWRFPFRPFSTPYPNWGPPFAGLNIGVGGPGFGFGQPGFGQPGFGQPGFGQPGFGQPGFGQPGFGQPGFGQPGFGQPGFGQPGFGQQPGFGGGFGNQPGGFFGGGGFPGNPAAGASPFNPYPAGPGTPYPIAPYYDGYYPVYRE